MPTDHEILGVPIDASKEDIKRAYRHIAHSFHPDKNKNPEASSIFTKATKAYDNLIAIREATPGRSSGQKNRRGQDIKVSLTATLDEIVKGSKRHITTTRKGKCNKCGGTGSEQKKTKTCSYCNGSGFQGMALVMGQKKACILCNGSGIIPEGNKCNSCSGTGIANETIHKEVAIGPFSERMLIHGSGNYCINGDYGNLIIEIYRDKHPLYTIHGLNINGELTISPAQAVIGDKVYMNVFGTREEVIIPPGIQNNSFVEKPNAGIKFGDKQGWLKIKIKITIPPVVSAEERNHYEQILKIEKEASTCLRTWII